MPIYEYQCETCGIRFERWQSIKEEPLKTCPECAGPVHRLIQPVGIIFKGSGFYTTDYRQSPSLSSTRHEPKGVSDSEKGDSPAESETTKPEKGAAE
ncbi:MAG: zinc ribbon domain-containing protein [Chloroflexi bacterium]|nr:zinc ribbon domain-containing protein [Chloroflexota bacterium]